MSKREKKEDRLSNKEGKAKKGWGERKDFRGDTVGNKGVSGQKTGSGEKKTEGGRERKVPKQE